VNPYTWKCRNWYSYRRMWISLRPDPIIGIRYFLGYKSAAVNCSTAAVKLRATRSATATLVVSTAGARRESSKRGDNCSMASAIVTTRVWAHTPRAAVPSRRRVAPALLACPAPRVLWLRRGERRSVYRAISPCRATDDDKNGEESGEEEEVLPFTHTLLYSPPENHTEGGRNS
jgi:hypothetical protein